MYVSAHGRVASAVLEVLCFYKPGFVLLLFFKEIYGKRRKYYIFSLTSTQGGWERELLSTPDLCSINLYLQQYLLCFTSEDCVCVRLWDLFVRRSGKYQCCEFLFC